MEHIDENLVRQIIAKLKDKNKEIEILENKIRELGREKEELKQKIKFPLASDQIDKVIEDLKEKGAIVEEQKIRKYMETLETREDLDEFINILLEK